MEFLVLGVVVAVNFIIIKMKLDRKRWEDAVFDTGILLIIMALFSGSFAGLIVGSVASLFISLYFFASPPTFFSDKDKGFFKEFLERAKRTER
jgi:Mn2+/Fe2+ NRAMP family transporter